MKKVITANQAAGWGAYLAKSQVVSAYPITPQTSIIETLASLMPKASWKYKFLTVESEHSAMASCITASLTGARVFTATSSQGLLLMHELLHWASGGRLPIVMVNVNRAIAPGWNIWTDQQDSLSQRDTGWAQIYCASAQEALDSVIIGFALAETIQAPVMIVLDAFYLSHTAEAVDIPTLDQVTQFLPTRKPVFAVRQGTREAFGEFMRGEAYQKMRHELAIALGGADKELNHLQKEWAKAFGRVYQNVETYRMEDAETAFVTSATPAVTARLVIDQFRANGVKVGLVRVRLFRPFPAQILRDTLSGIPKVAVLDRNFSWGARGIFFQELQAALYSLKSNSRPQLYGYIHGLGGTDITPSIIEEIIKLTRDRNEPDPEVLWLTEEKISPNHGQTVQAAGKH